MSIYLDYNATTPVDPRVLDVMVDVYKYHYGNPDSRTHSFGDDTRVIVENARKQVASLLGVTPNEIFFTSGSTESSNIAIQGLSRYAKESGKFLFVTSAIEHKAVLETVKAMQLYGFQSSIVHPNRFGIVSADSILKEVTDQTVLVSLMHVNNETGMIQPVQQLGDELSKRDVLFHIDATQSCGKLVDEIRNLKYSMLSFSAHKMGGPQGIGVLVLRRKNYKLPPVKNIMYGGQQEKGVRPGTVPVALVAGCGKACEIAEKEYAVNRQRCKEIQQIILKMLDHSSLTWSINGETEHSIGSTLNICLHGVNAEALMLASKSHCSISNGSACTSKNYGYSYVLEAMGLSQSEMANSIRISWSATVDKTELKNEFSSLLEIAKNLAT